MNKVTAVSPQKNRKSATTIHNYGVVERMISVLASYFELKGISFHVTWAYVSQHTDCPPHMSLIKFTSSFFCDESWSKTFWCTRPSSLLWRPTERHSTDLVIMGLIELGSAEAAFLPALPQQLPVTSRTGSSFGSNEGKATLQKGLTRTVRVIKARYADQQTFSNIISWQPNLSTEFTANKCTTKVSRSCVYEAGQINFFFLVTACVPYQQREEQKTVSCL